MGLPASISLIKALTIWLILVLSNHVGNSLGSRMHLRRLKFNHHAKFNGFDLYMRRLKFRHHNKYVGKFTPTNSHKLSSPSSYPSSNPYYYNPPYPSSNPYYISPPYPSIPTISPITNPPTNTLTPSNSPTSTSPLIQPSSPPHIVTKPTFPSISPLNPPLSPPTNPSSPPLIVTKPISPSTSPLNSPKNTPIHAFTPSPSPILSNPPTIPFIPIISPNVPFNHPTITPSISPIPSKTPIDIPSPLTIPFAPTISPPTNPPTIPFPPSPSPILPPTSPSFPPIESFSPSISPANPLPNAPNTSISTPPISPPIPSKPLGLQVGFYKGLCPNINVDVESSITTKVQEEFQKDASLLAALLRMQFHDCFVHGCDASILIDGTSTEKNAGPNLRVRGYEFIDTLKDVAESECPGVVSCADIIAIATKELIKLGGGPEYLVETGRRDGMISRAEDVKLPSPFGSVAQSISAFAAKKFTNQEMVALFGCHTVGISHCTFFQDRLYRGTRDFDSNMDPNLCRQLIPTCPQGSTSNNFTSLDQNHESSNIFDNSFYDQILKQRGILPIDQALARDSNTRGFVQQFATNGPLFNSKLVDAMIKLQALDVLTGDQGQIRKVCSKFN